MLGMQDKLVMNHGVWAGSDPVDKDISDERWPIRVLVCGNTGVGKSTLINRVFGVPVVRYAPSQDRVYLLTVQQADPCERDAGVHDIWKNYTWEDRPDLIIHDSRGFQCASEEEILSVEKFLEGKAGKEKPKDRLHVIW